MSSFDLEKVKAAVKSLEKDPSDLLFAMTEDGTVACVTPALLELLGFESEEFVGSHYSTFLQEKDLQRATEKLEQSKSWPFGAEFEAHFSRSDGNFCHLL